MCVEEKKKDIREDKLFKAYVGKMNWIKTAGSSQPYKIIFSWYC